MLEQLVILKRWPQSSPNRKLYQIRAEYLSSSQSLIWITRKWMDMSALVNIKTDDRCQRCTLEFRRCVFETTQWHRGTYRIQVRLNPKGSRSPENGRTRNMPVQRSARGRSLSLLSEPILIYVVRAEPCAQLATVRVGYRNPQMFEAGKPGSYTASFSKWLTWWNRSPPRRMKNVVVI